MFLNGLKGIIRSLDENESVQMGNGIDLEEREMRKGRKYKNRDKTIRIGGEIDRER